MIQENTNNNISILDSSLGSQINFEDSFEQRNPEKNALFSSNKILHSDQDSNTSMLSTFNDSFRFLNLRSQTDLLMKNLKEPLESQQNPSQDFQKEPKFFKKTSEDLRRSYLYKLNKCNIIPETTLNSHVQKIERKYNSITIFDWDDTLLCTSYLMKHGMLYDNTDSTLFLNYSSNRSNSNLNNTDDSISQTTECTNELTKEQIVVEKIRKLEKKVIKILLLSLELGDTYIITNASKGWVEFSAMKYYPNLFKLLSKVKIISARSAFEKLYPKDNFKWKLCAFNYLSQLYNKNLITNIICIGDSFIEMEAGQKMISVFKEVCVKIIKFREQPKIDQMSKELDLVYNKFKFIHSSARNIYIKVEKKDKVK